MVQLDSMALIALIVPLIFSLETDWTGLINRSNGHPNACKLRERSQYTLQAWQRPPLAMH
jgi:hypothetical protein